MINTEEIKAEITLHDGDKIDYKTFNEQVLEPMRNGEATKRAKELKLKEFPDFIETYFSNHREHLHGEDCAEYISDFLVGCFYALSYDMDITGGQAYASMRRFFEKTYYSNSKCGCESFSWDRLLYPQQCKKEDVNVIPQYVWDKLRAEATERLNRDYSYPIHPDVERHWRNIANGVVPSPWTVQARESDFYGQ